MNQALIDLLREELPPEEARELCARVEREPELRRELEELRGILALVRRGEEIEPAPALRARVLRAAAAARRSPLRAFADALAALPALAGFRFRHSRGFRVALLSAAAHVVVLAFLFQRLVVSPREERPVETVLDAHVQDALVPASAIRPDRALVLRLRQRQVPHGARLAAAGLPGQAEAIERGVRALLAAQAPDGSFGSAAETGRAALVLLAEGATSTGADVLDAALARAVRHLQLRMDREAPEGAGVAALLEDYVLTWDERSAEERSLRLGVVLRALRRLPDDEFAAEAAALARLAGLGTPEGVDLGAARFYLAGPRADLLAGPATRLAATAALARGQDRLDVEAVRAWAAPLFREAMRRLEERPADALAVLTLQAPYRL